MIFKKYLRLEGKHAFLSASKHHWVGYDESKLVATFSSWLAAQRGTELHAFACKAIELGVALPPINQALNNYVNDGILYKMETEQTLWYSDNCFGTADTISFTDGLLRIHDLKTGTTKASLTQLEIYAALFCLDYNHRPDEIGIELRLYQADSVLIYNPEPSDILRIMDKIIFFDKRIEELKAGG